MRKAHLLFHGGNVVSMDESESVPPGWFEGRPRRIATWFPDKGPARALAGWWGGHIRKDEAQLCEVKLPNRRQAARWIQGKPVKLRR